MPGLGRQGLQHGDQQLTLSIGGPLVRAEVGRRADVGQVETKKRRSRGSGKSAPRVMVIDQTAVAPPKHHDDDACASKLRREIESAFRFEIYSGAIYRGDELG